MPSSLDQKEDDAKTTENMTARSVEESKTETHAEANNDSIEVEAPSDAMKREILQKSESARPLPKKRRKKRRRRKAKRRGSGESSRSMRSLPLPTIAEDEESECSDSDDDDDESVVSCASYYSYQCYHTPSKTTRNTVPTKISHDIEHGNCSGNTSDNSSLDDPDDELSEPKEGATAGVCGGCLRWLQDLTNKEKWMEAKQYLSDKRNWRSIVKSRIFLCWMIVVLFITVVAIAIGSRRSSISSGSPQVVAPPTNNPSPSPTGTRFEVSATGVSLNIPDVPPGAIPTPSPSFSPTPKQTPPEEVESLYYNAGETISDYRDAGGRVWQPLQLPEGSTTHSLCINNPEFANTLDPTLYCTEVWMPDADELEFNIPLPNGQYQVILHFAETFVTGPGERVMDIVVEDQILDRDYDIYAEAEGDFVATQWFASVDVTDSILSILLVPIIENAKVNAIEIHARGFERSPEDFIMETEPFEVVMPPTPPPTPSPPLRSAEEGFAFRWNLGHEGPPVTVNGDEWLPDLPEIDFSSGTSRLNSICSDEEVGVEQLYCSERWFQGVQGSFEIPVPPGQYRITMYFAELFNEEAGARVFNVLVENLVVRRGFDILDQPHFSTVISFSRDTQVNDGFVSIALHPLVGNPTISAIEVTEI